MESELRLVVDTLPILVWTALPDGQVDFLNQRWCDYTGLTLEQARGTGWVRAICADDVERLTEYWRSLLASGEPGEIEARIRRWDGEFRWFLFRASPLRSGSGNVEKWYGTNTDIEDRVRAEDVLGASARHFRHITDCIPALISVMTPSGKTEVVNRRALHYIGKPIDEIAEWESTSDIVHPDDLPEVIKAWQLSVETGDPYDVKHRIRRADGVYRWFHVRGLPLRDEEGRIVRWYVLMVDIHDQHLAETLLAGEKRLLEMLASGRSLSTILEELCRLVEAETGARCSIVLVDSRGKHLEYGVAPSLPESFLGSIVGREVGPESGPCAMAAYLNKQVIVADVASDTRWEASQWCTAALARGILSCCSTPIPARNGNAIGAFAIYYDEPRVPTDVDQSLIAQFRNLASIAIERVQSDLALRQSEAFLAQAQQLSQTGSFSWRVTGDRLIWSKQTYDIYDIDPSLPATFDRIIARLYPDDVEVFEEIIERARRDCEDFEFEQRLQNADGSLKYLYIVAHGSRDTNGAIEYIGAVQDITGRRLSETALEEAKSELSRVARLAAASALTASIAHEVNQPLSGIIANASTSLRILTEDSSNLAPAIEAIRRTIRDGNRAAQVVSRVRALYKRAEVSSEWVDLNEAIREVIALLGTELRRAKAVISTELAHDLPLVKGDRVQLQQVILNLLQNGMDAMATVTERTRSLVVRTDRDEDDRVLLCVQDVGIGLNPEKLDQPFEAFYTTKEGGMGIGLSISRSIIESHDGRLWAMPNGGPGATFAFSIPREFDSDAATA